MVREKVDRGGGCGVKGSWTAVSSVRGGAGGWVDSGVVSVVVVYSVMR